MEKNREGIATRTGVLSGIREIVCLMSSNVI